MSCNAKYAITHGRPSVQRDSSPNAGFRAEGVKPWMRVNDNYPTVNAVVQPQRPADGQQPMPVHAFWKRDLKNRQEHKDVSVYGDYRALEEGHPKVFSFARTGSQKGMWITVLNFSKDEVDYEIPTHVKLEGWMTGNYTNGKPEKETNGKIKLGSWEGLLGKCT